MTANRDFRVFLVEDDLSHAELTKDCFEQSNISCTIDWVEDGEAALRYLRKQDEFSSAARPDLVILDLNLPKKDGREVLKEIKTDIHLKGLPVVVLTTSGSEADVINAYELGANCYITKPITYSQFVAVIEQIERFWFEVTRLPRNGDVEFRPLPEDQQTERKAPQ